MYVYFISYMWTTSQQTGHGCLESKQKKKITSIEPIKEIGHWLNKHEKDNYGNPVSAVVLNYILLREE